MGIWDEVKKADFGAKEEKAPSIWDDVKSGKIEPVKGLKFEDLLAPVTQELVTVNNKLPMGTVSFDIETGSASDMWTSDKDFVRLSGYSLDEGEVIVTTNHSSMTNIIQGMSGWVIGHNIMNFDLILLAKHYNLNLLKLAKQDRIIDTKLLAFLSDPPFSRTQGGEIERMYSLQTTGTKYLGEGKMVDVATGSSVLKELAREFGGFDKIPTDHPRYIQYLKVDVERTRDLAKVLPMREYTRREHRVAAVCATISIGGFRVDVPLLEERIQQGEEKRTNILNSLMGYGLPGPEETKAPHRTTKGINAIDAAFKDLGVTLPRTERSGKPALGKDILLGVVEETNSQEVKDLAGAVLSLNGIRTIYGNIQDNLVGDRTWGRTDSVLETLAEKQRIAEAWTPKNMVFLGWLLDGKVTQSARINADSVPVYGYQDWKIK